MSLLTIKIDDSDVEVIIQFAVVFFKSKLLFLPELYVATCKLHINECDIIVENKDQ